MDVDTSRWSGEGEFTALLLERLRDLGEIAALRVEDAPAGRAESDYNFVSNELFVTFRTETRRTPVRRFGFWPGSNLVMEKLMDVAGLERTLTAIADVGAPDYGDESMLQYLRTETIIQPYQTRGYKLIELVRIYEAGSAPRR